MDTRHSTTPRPFYEAVSPFARLAPIIEKGPPPTGFLRPGKKAWALTPGSAAATVEKGEPGRGVAVVPLDVGPAGLRLYILDEDDPGITERINGLWGDAPQLTAFTPTGGRHRYALTERRDLPAKNGVVKGKLDTRAYGKVSYVVGPGSITTEAAYDSEKRPSTEGPWRYRLEVDPRLVGEDGSIEIPALPVKVEDWLASKNGAKKAKAKAAETGRDYAAEPPDEWRKIVEATLRRHTDGTTDFHGAIQLAVGQAWNLGIEHRPTLIAAGRMAEDRYAGREKRPGEVERWADWFLEGNAERQPGEPTEYERRMAARDRAQAAQERAGAAGPSTGPESAPEPQERAGAEIEAAAGASTRRSKAEWLAEQGYTNLPDAAEHYARLVAIHERSEDWSDAAEALATAAAGYAEQLKARGHAPPPVAGFEFDRNRPEVSFRRRLAAVGIQRLWAEDELEYQGKYYTVPKTRLITRPAQRPHPPIWVAANNDAAIRRAARWGYPWLINPHATVPTVADQWTRYVSELESAGNPVPADLPMMREMYVAADRETAYIESQPYLEGKYAAYASWGQDKALPGEESFSVPYQDLAKDRFLLGSPDDVVAELKRYSQDLGVNMMIFRMQWPGMPQEQVLRQIELLGREVIPQVADL